MFGTNGCEVADNACSSKGQAVLQLLLLFLAELDPTLSCFSLSSFTVAATSALIWAATALPSRILSLTNGVLLSAILVRVAADVTHGQERFNLVLLQRNL
jgi:hypothetical protein